VRSGTLKDDPGLRPSYHAFTASKSPWVDIRDAMPQFAEYPDPATIKKLMGSG